MKKKVKCCKYCGESFDGLNSQQKTGHTAWCLKNPKAAQRRELYKSYTEATKNSESLEKRRKSITKAHADGKYKECHARMKGVAGHPQSESSKEKIRQGQLKNPRRRLFRSCRKYLCKDGSEVLLDSSWEEALARRLDNLNVEWSRPDPIPYIDKNGIKHNYFPDFYLPEFDMYLDPKNPAAFQAQKDKVEILQRDIPNLQFLRTLKECETYAP